MPKVTTLKPRLSKLPQRLSSPRQVRDTKYSPDATDTLLTATASIAGSISEEFLPPAFCRHGREGSSVVQHRHARIPTNNIPLLASLIGGLPLVAIYRQQQSYGRIPS